MSIVCNVPAKRGLYLIDRPVQASSRVENREVPSKVPSRACRALFTDAEPIDSDELSRDVNAHLAEVARNQSHKWGFDFVNEIPCNDHPRYKWECIPQGEAPSLYAAVGKPYKIHRPIPTRYDSFDLMDATEETANITDILNAEVAKSPPQQQSSKRSSRMRQLEITDFCEVRKRSTMYLSSQKASILNCSPATATTTSTTTPSQIPSSMMKKRRLL